MSCAVLELEVGGVVEEGIGALPLILNQHTSELQSVNAT
jgi:hypothetical protein